MSSLRYKQDVRDLDRGLATVMQLRPRMFRWKPEMGLARGDDLGFIAEEVADVDPLLATYGVDGAPGGVKYHHMTALLTQGIQELSQIVEQQNETIAQQAQENRHAVGGAETYTGFAILWVPETHGNHCGFDTPCDAIVMVWSGNGDAG